MQTKIPQKSQIPPRTVDEEENVIKKKQKEHTVKRNKNTLQKVK